MTALTRMWGAVAALGAALIALAVGAAASPWLAVPMLVAGAGQAAVAVAALRGTRWPVWLVVTPLALPTLLWLGTLLAAPAALPSFPLLVESALALGSGALLLVRRSAEDEQRPRFAVVGLLSSAAVVGVITTVALSGTSAGDFAQPHGAPGGGAQEHSGP